MVAKTRNFASCRFPGQRALETVQLLIRKHWVMDLEIAVLFFLIGLIPVGLATITELFVWNGWNDRFFISLMGLSLYLLLILLVVYVKWLNEELDLIIVTNERVVSHEQIDLFHRQISEAHISQLQDVKGIQKGVFASLFSYGDLEIQTSSPDTFFFIKRIPEPYESARLILDLRDQCLKTSRNA